jgi:peptidyl-prolyl cis-trans isomerase B (cyclophilin B)
MHAIAVAFFSLLFPVKAWVAPQQPLQIQVKTKTPVTLVMTDFAGQGIEPANEADAAISADKTVDINKIFPAANTPGTYLLYAVAKDKQLPDFDGTPLVINVLNDRRRNTPNQILITHVEPLCYAVARTDQGDMTLGFYYDVAPHTVDNFLGLASGGFYDGLTFHRIVPDFVIQGGDPLGDGTGGPGYQITAEFNERPHLPGVLSMARNGDPLEQQPPFPLPRPQFANTAGSQFFVCLDYDKTKALDGRYTAFGKVVTGMDTVKKIAATPIADPSTGRPAKPPVIQKIEVHPVTAKENPYLHFTESAPAATQP